MKYLSIILLGALFAACAEGPKTEQSEAEMTSDSQTNTDQMTKYAKDTHSFSEPDKVAITHLDLDIDVDFDTRVISGTATYDLERNSGNVLTLDERDLTIERVYDPETGTDLPFAIEKGNERGDALAIELGDDTRRMSVKYATSPKAAALLWMEPAQTNGGTAPFMFTQGQAILTRSWIPIQDTPAIRITYDAKVHVPKDILALMSAKNPTSKNESGRYTFKMELPIPPYLMALAVGDLAFESLGDRTGVYAEPGMLDKAAYELADTEKMLEAAESLYGPYKWGRYDVLILPPGFPFGGMENPRLTFATPTIIVGDRSLTALIAHEMAHSWSGNLVTNATWDDFWLNEGFTVYFEKRIMEELYGKDYAEMLNELGYQDLMSTMEDLGPQSDDTKLKLNLDGRDPDDGMTDIAYEKGYMFLHWLETIVGRERFDAFLKQYFEDHAFETMTTAEFVKYLDGHLLNELDERPDVEAWIYKPGLPEGHPVPHSTLFDKVDTARVKWMDGAIEASDMPVDTWSSHEWLYFIRGLSGDIGTEPMSRLDATFDFTHTKNSEIAAAWFELAIENDYQKAFPELAKFLERVGRRKFLQPLYEALAKTPEHKQWAIEVYRIARPNYHAVSAQTIDDILGVDGGDL